MTDTPKTAWLFPGQGAQFVGMAKDLTDQYSRAAALFRRANDIVGYNLLDICINGPEDKLNATAVSQPAIFTLSAALLDILSTSQDVIHPDICAGLSMGEYTAIYAAGMISFEDGLRLVQKRGDAMQAAAEASEGSMVSIIGLDDAQIVSLCERASGGDLLVAVNFNCPGQIVLSGTPAACQRAAELAEPMGAMKAVPLSVAGAFHTELMAPAAAQLELALNACEINDSVPVKVIANIHAEYYNGADDIRRGLVRQLVQPILWQKCMERLLADGVENFYEIGPGRVLTGLMKRIHRRIKVVNISTAESIQQFLESEK